jgi:glutaredoxin
MEKSSDLVLYHILNDDDCAEVRRFIVENELVERVRFRNIDRSEEATKALHQLSERASVPALWAHQKLYIGKVEILAYLKSQITSS